MPQIPNAIAAVIEADLVKLNPEQKKIVQNYSDKLLKVQDKAHQPRTFELTVKTMKEQLEQLSASLKKMNLETAPDKDKRRHEMIEKIESDLKLIESCITGDFEKNYQNLKKGFLEFLLHPESNSVVTNIGKLLEKDDPSILTSIEYALEHASLDNGDPEQLANLIVLMKLKVAHTPNPVVTKNLSQDVSLLQLQGEIEKQRMIAIIDGQEPLARALKYLSIGCTTTAAKTRELQKAIVERGKDLQAYRHQDKCRELGGRIVLHCSQAMLPGMGLKTGMCHGLARHWAEEVIKKDRFMGFRGNQEVYIQPNKPTDKILQAIPSFNDFVRLNPKIYETQQSQEKHIDYEDTMGSEPEKQFEEFIDRIMLELDKYGKSATFASYANSNSGHVVAIHKRTKPTPQGFLIDYFDANAGWMQFKDDKSFKEFFTYYLNDRHAKEKLKSIAFETKCYPCSYTHILDKLSEKAPQPTPQRQRAQSLSAEIEKSTPQINEKTEKTEKTEEKLTWSSKFGPPS
ncbi:TPA: hypothetical protein JBE16_12100 [Legionella pneumophila subsp. pneumophila]|uniref:hypothetical protein n=1 Tax=Legionella sp. PATHC039 TaxID=2992042 RepID=UPI001A21D781|nr:hypothetical protein [Legionella sp. PATHC039]MCW8396832.1 hypothetical protein [Legionella sp. PATHC039]HAT8858143.1 hypothetical protein [Legionella pneumophila subsp. pneumophila]HAT9650289.1 hypothetical protein [Legionella pneumophila subsp. pneumophila]HAT9920927.1 hypothetical protein [Legionella pneumophila subsp. pneumophila]